MRYTVDATITVSLEQVSLLLDEPIKEELNLHDALLQLLNKRLALLDIKGGRSGDGGFISTIDCESIDNWEAE